MTRIEKDKKIIKVSQKLKSLKTNLESRLRKTEAAFNEVKDLSHQLDHLKQCR